MNNNDSQAKPVFSSIFTVISLVSAGILIYFLPPFFSIYPASLANLVLFLCTLLICLFFCLILIRRKNLHFSITPLAKNLSILLFLTFISIIFNHFFYPEKTLLSFGGFFISFCLIGIFASTLISSKSNQKVILGLLLSASLASFLSLLALLNYFYHFLPPVILTNFNFPILLNLNLIFLGLASIFSHFFKKAKFKTSHLFFLPLIVLGFLATVFLHFNLSSIEVPTFFLSWQVAIASSTENIRNFLIGNQAQTYADIYNLYQNTQTFQQAFNLPLTFTTLFGFLPTFAWLALVIKTALLAFQKTEENNYLFFILLVSFVVQLFTPIYPLILLIQAIIIAFATNKKRQTLIKFNFSTLFTHENGQQQIEHKDHSHLFSYCLAGFFLLLTSFATLRLSQSYLGYFYHHLSVSDSTSLNNFYQKSLKAVAVAPFIDTFNRYAAIANLEMMINNVVNDAEKQQSNLQQQALLAEKAEKYAQKAIVIEPSSATNYLTLAAIYQEISLYVDTQSSNELSNRIISNYAEAVSLQPYNPEIYLSWANFYQSRNNYKDALTLYQQALTLDQQNLLTYYGLATLYHQKGDLELAKSSYQNALNLLDPNSSNYQENYNLIQAKIQSII